MAYNMRDDIKEVYFTEEQLRDKVRELGARITEDYRGKNPLIVSVLKGSYIFMSDLTRAIDTPCNVDFMVVSSYGNGTKTTGEVQIIKDIAQPIDGRDLLIVEDILDSGVTLHYLMQILAARGANSIRLCTLLSKPERRKIDVNVDYLGFEIPDEFVVGYGLDYAEKYRNLPYIGILKPHVYGGRGRIISPIRKGALNQFERQNEGLRPLPAHTGLPARRRKLRRQSDAENRVDLLLGCVQLL